MSRRLAMHGGKPVRNRLFPAYNTIGAEEKGAVLRVLDSGILSGYYGAWMEGFWGGPEVQALEREWAQYFKVKHAIAVNSCTSGLYCAAGAIGIGPGDEVITTPVSMMATATAILLFNAVPVFSDIEEDYFCLDAEKLVSAITDRTKAIFVTNICGQPYHRDAINAIAKEHGLYVVEDNAQSPLATYGGKFAGTLGDIGVFSLNYHKHIHCGEGGVVCTDDDRLADRVRMIRNHAEAVAVGRALDERLDLSNLIGFNFRMTEVEAAITRMQLKKLAGLVAQRVENVRYIENGLMGLPLMKPAPVRKDASHVYYVHPLLFDSTVAGFSKQRFVEAVGAELPRTELREVEKTALIDAGFGYPTYWAPLYQELVGFGLRQHCPFRCPHYRGVLNYQKGLCPVGEHLYLQTLVVHELMRPPMTQSDLDDVVMAFWKVWECREELR